MSSKKKKIWRFNRNLIAAAHDAAMAGLSFMCSVYLRLGEDQLYLAADYLSYGTVFFILICMAVFISMRLYQGLWRYASMRDLVTIVKAVTLSILIFSVVMFQVNRLEGIPRSLLVINWMLLLFMLGGPRFAYRAMKDHTLTWRMLLNETPKIPVLLVGANDNAERFIRELARDVQTPYQVIAIMDNKMNRKGRSIHHIPIYGGDLPTVVESLDKRNKRPQKIILTDPAVAGDTVRDLLAVADGLNIPLARLPRAGEIRVGLDEKRAVQPIAVEDLLGRPQNVLDRESMRALIEGQTVLVTGAGGTIGGELVHQIAGFGPAKLLLLDASEFNLYRIERELCKHYPHQPMEALLADVRNTAHIEHIFTQTKPSLVFHAAAIKHVPISEFNPEEAMLTNVFGTLNIADACLTHDVKAMVMVSTDKAVNPTNIMGASKRLAETVCQAMSEDRRGKTKYVTVRFGNVLGSTGSVVPLFQEQLEKGGPLTVTHPDVTRYFMTVREAVELVLQSAALGAEMTDRRGYIFVLDMGQPVRILDLATQMIRLAGLKPRHDIEIVFTGLRPGEKLYEELFYDAEHAWKTSHDSIYLASPAQPDGKILQAGLHKLLEACQGRDTKEAIRMLATLVPEYISEQTPAPYREVPRKTGQG
jgi:FlaA1/EpsC-like NDP-sugar epimerase